MNQLGSRTDEEGREPLKEKDKSVNWMRERERERERDGGGGGERLNDIKGIKRSVS